MMKRKIYLFIFILHFFAGKIFSQPADGTIAADFSFKDMNGVTQHLYDYLNQGKYIVLDVSATWCPPCWEYHSNVKTMEALYEKHDIPGDKKWKVLFVEGDASTTDDDMKGVGNNTMGNWVEGTPFPMCNPPLGADLSNFLKAYTISGVPTLLLICPDKKVYASVLNDPTASWPDVAGWENVALSCGTTTGINVVEDINFFNVYPNPANEQLSLYFNLPQDNNVKLKVINVLGQVIDTKDFGIRNGGNQTIPYSIEGFSTGIYNFIITINDNKAVSKKVMIQ